MVWAAVLAMLLVLAGCWDRKSIANTDDGPGGPPAISVAMVEVKPAAINGVKAGVYREGKDEYDVKPAWFLFIALVINWFRLL